MYIISLTAMCVASVCVTIALKRINRFGCGSFVND